MPLTAVWIGSVTHASVSPVAPCSTCTPAEGSSPRRKEGRPPSCRSSGVVTTADGVVVVVEKNAIKESVKRKTAVAQPPMRRRAWSGLPALSSIWQDVVLYVLKAAPVESCCNANRLKPHLPWPVALHGRFGQAGNDEKRRKF